MKIKQPLIKTQIYLVLTAIVFIIVIALVCGSLLHFFSSLSWFYSFLICLIGQILFQICTKIYQTWIALPIINSNITKEQLNSSNVEEKENPLQSAILTVDLYCQACGELNRQLPLDLSKEENVFVCQNPRCKQVNAIVWDFRTQLRTTPLNPQIVFERLKNEEEKEKNNK